MIPQNLVFLKQISSKPFGEIRVLIPRLALDPAFLFGSMAKETIEVQDSQLPPVLPDNQLGLEEYSTEGTVQDTQMAEPVEPQAAQDVPSTPELPENDLVLQQLEAELEKEMGEALEMCAEQRKAKAAWEAAQAAKDAARDAAFELSPTKDEKGSLVECNQCGLSVSPADAQVRGTLTWWCNNCNAATKQLRSKMQWPPQSFQKLSLQEKRDFWKETHKLKEEDGELKYQRLRDVLVQQVGTKLVREWMKAKGGKYLPLGVYQKKLGQQLGLVFFLRPLGPQFVDLFLLIAALWVAILNAFVLQERVRHCQNQAECPFGVQRDPWRRVLPRLAVRGQRKGNSATGGGGNCCG